MGSPFKLAIVVFFVALASTVVAQRWAEENLLPFEVYDVALEPQRPEVWRDDEHTLLRRLVVNLDTHQEAARFLVRRRVVLADGRLCVADAAYDRPRATLEFRVNNRPRSRWTGVSEPILRQVAIQSGRWDDLASLGCRRAPVEA